MESIKSVSTKPAEDSAHAASTASYYSLQCRTDFLLKTHLPSLTRDLARAVDEALRGKAPAEEGGPREGRGEGAGKLHP